MSLEFTTSPEIVLEQLTSDQHGQIINQNDRYWREGLRARSTKEVLWDRCWKAYLMWKDPRYFPKETWRTRTTVTWMYDSVESATDEIMNVSFPTNEDFFKVDASISGNEIHELNSFVMTKALSKRFRNASFKEQYRVGIQQAAIVGTTVWKELWKTDTRQRTQNVRTDDGQNIPSKITEIVFNGPSIEVIRMQDFVVWPLVKNLNMTNCVHRVVRRIDDIKGNPVYKNTEDLHIDGSLTDTDLHSQVSNHSHLFGVHQDLDNEDRLIELLEVWGDFVIADEAGNDILYRNYIATTAKNQNKLIRFEPNPYESGEKPFVVQSYREVPNHFYGFGLIEPNLDYYAMGNTMTNMMFDEAKLKIHGQYKYEPDGIFDPDTFSAKPGGAHPVGDINNLQAINPNINLNFGFAERNTVKGEMEESTGVTQFSKGANTAGKSRTARESVLLAQAGSRKFLAIADHFNTGLKRLVSLGYGLVKQFEDPTVLAIETGTDPVLVQQLDLPFDDDMIKITGLQTSLKRQTVLENIERAFTVLGNSPAATIMNFAEMADEYMKALQFEESERFLLPPEIRNIVQELQIAQILGLVAGPQSNSDGSKTNSKEARDRTDGEKSDVNGDGGSIGG